MQGYWVKFDQVQKKKIQEKNQEMKIRPPELRGPDQTYCTAKNDETSKSVNASKILEHSNLPNNHNQAESQDKSENSNLQIITLGKQLELGPEVIKAGRSSCTPSMVL